MEADEALRTVDSVNGVKASQFVYNSVPDAMLREAVAAWLNGGDYAGLFAAACEKGFEDAVDYLIALEELENE